MSVPALQVAVCQLRQLTCEEGRTSCSGACHGQGGVALIFNATDRSGQLRSETDQKDVPWEGLFSLETLVEPGPCLRRQLHSSLIIHNEAGAFWYMQQWLDKETGCVSLCS